MNNELKYVLLHIINMYYDLVTLFTSNVALNAEGRLKKQNQSCITSIYSVCTMCDFN